MYIDKLMFSHALPLCITQIGRFEFCTSWRVNRNDLPKCQQLGKTVRNRWCQRAVYPFRTRAEAHHGLFGRGSVRKAIESQTKRPFSQGSLAKLLWQGSEQFDIPTFFYPYWRKIQAYKKTSQECILAATLRIERNQPLLR